MEENAAQKVGVVALIFAMLAIALAIMAAKTVITEDLDMDNYYIDNTNTIEIELRIPASNLGRNPTNPPVTDVYGICHVAEFTVGSDLAYYKINIPEDLAGTTACVHFHWTRSTSGSDESGREVNWQLKYLSVTENENVHTGESTDNILDTYLDVDTTSKIIYKTECITITGLTVGEILLMEISAIASPGTTLVKPALLEFCIVYEAYQVTPPP